MCAAIQNSIKVYLRKVKFKKHPEMTPLGRVRAVALRSCTLAEYKTTVCGMES